MGLLNFHKCPTAKDYDTLWGLWVLINHFPLVSAAGKTLFAGRALGCIPVQIGLGMARKALKRDITELRKHVEYWPAGHSVSMGCSTIISITVEVQIGPSGRATGN